MPEPRRLRNPPITEAIIDIRGEIAAGFDPVRLREAETLLFGRYALAGEQRLFVRTVSVTGEPGATLNRDEPALTGYEFRSGDGRFAAQFTVEGLTVSQLHGYTRWEDLAKEAAQLWDAYVRVASPQRVLRAGTRYLNRIQLPPPGVNWEEYFTSLPRIPDGVPQATSSFLVRMVLHEERSPLSVSITQYLEQTDYGSPWMILDIDAFSQDTYEMDASTMWEDLARLRELKNRVFFGSVTEQTLELFE